MAAHQAIPVPQQDAAAQLVNSHAHYSVPVMQKQVAEMTVTEPDTTEGDDEDIIIEDV